jgi:MFS transporter, Spinster family, sphingosine-1-phosphate transporter
MSVENGQRITTGAYLTLGYLTLLNVLNFIDRGLISSFANFIVPDLQLTNTEYGLLTGLVFIIFYAVAGLFVGALADLVHRPRLIAGAITLWSGLTAVSGAAVNFITLAIPRMFIGVGESALTPTSMSLLADHFPPNRRGLAAGVYYMGVPVGTGISLVIAGALGPAIGWRNCFYLLGGIGIVFAIGALMLREPRHTAVKVEQPKISTLAPVFFKAVADSPALRMTILAALSTHFILGAAAFDQLWLVKERGFEKSSIALTTGILLTFAGLAGNLFGGFASDLYMRKTGQGRARFLFWLFLALAPTGLAYRLVDPATPAFWICMVIGFFQVGAFYGPTFATVQDLCPPQVRATVVAFLILVLNLVGVALGVTGAGILVDHLISLGVHDPYSWMLFGFTALSCLAIPLFWLASLAYNSGEGARIKAAAREV